MNYHVTWDNDSFLILSRPSTKLEFGSPVVAYEGRLQYVRERVEGKQGVTIGCRVAEVSNPKWNWTTLNLALTTVFGFKIESPLLEVMKSCPTSVMSEMYSAHHGRELA